MDETLDPTEAEFRDLLQRIQVAGSFESLELTERLTELGDVLIARKLQRRAAEKAAKLESVATR